MGRGSRGGRLARRSCPLSLSPVRSLPFSRLINRAGAAGALRGPQAAPLPGLPVAPLAGVGDSFKGLSFRPCPFSVVSPALFGAFWVDFGAVSAFFGAFWGASSQPIRGRRGRADRRGTENRRRGCGSFESVGRRTRGGSIEGRPRRRFSDRAVAVGDSRKAGGIPRRCRFAALIVCQGGRNETPRRVRRWPWFAGAPSPRGRKAGPR